jgi:hypothetical protein
VRIEAARFDRAPHFASPASQGFNAMSIFSTRPSTSGSRRAPHVLRGTLTAALALMLAGCSSTSWVKSRFVEPEAPAAAASPMACGC